MLYRLDLLNEEITVNQAIMMAAGIGLAGGG